MNTKTFRISTVLLMALFITFTNKLSANEYKNLEDAVGAAENLINKKYKSKIKNKLATENLQAIVLNKKLSNEEKINRIIIYIKLQKKIETPLKNDLKSKEKKQNKTNCVKDMTIPGLEMKLVYVAPNNFPIGVNYDAGNLKSVHHVRISKGYWIGKYEVTQNEYERIMGHNPSKFKGPNKPVEKVSWNDAIKFCKKLTARERAEGRLPSGIEYRLPTEAEWEYAARGGIKSRGYKYSGSNNIGKVAWYKDNAGVQMHEVGTKAGNELGIHDMSGNVYEWCNNYWHDKYSSNSGTDGSSGSDRVIRGGCLIDKSAACRSTNRDAISSSMRCNGLGFRILRSSKL